jgi:hypothetical protein
MAHFAELDSSSVVVNVIVISDSDTAEKPNTSIDGFRTVRGKELESIGIDFCESLYGHRRWVQTSYNDNMRKQYATIGDTYDATKDKFIRARPFASWTLDANDDWWPPKNPPDGTHVVWDTYNPWATNLDRSATYIWKEDSSEWYEVENTTD